MKMLLCLIPLLGLVPALARADVTFQVIASYEDPKFVSTTALGIDDAGRVVGSLDDEAGHLYGYIRTPDGRFSNRISYPGSDFTGVLGINNSGEVCGYYNGGIRPGDAFRARHGRFITTDFPGADYNYVFGLNDAGDFSGTYSNGGAYSAFVNIGKVYTSIAITGQDYVVATDVNNLNQSVGYYYSDSGEHSFFRDADGSLTYPLDAPGFELTAILGLNDAGHMVGIAGNADGTSSAVLLLSTSEVARYNYPGAVETAFTGINNSGIISGYWLDEQLAAHALIVAATISEE